jgi:hypothetical protein
MAALEAVVLAGPDPAVDAAGWRGAGASAYSETGILRPLWSMDLSHRKTRPRHPQTDEKAQQAFKRSYGRRTVELQ